MSLSEVLATYCKHPGIKGLDPFKTFLVLPVYTEVIAVEAFPFGFGARLELKGLWVFGRFRLSARL